MKWSLTNIYVQPVAVLATSEPSGASSSDAPLADSAGKYFKRLDSTVPESSGEIVLLNQVLRKTFSDTPVLWKSELAREYQDLGEALTQMRELDQDSEWRIDRPVYDAARFVASGLMHYSFPAPRVFTHGPDSVVFNWSQESDNLYLTVSANRISALISSPERIRRRLDYSANEALDPSKLLGSIKAAHSGQPVLMLASSTSDPSDFLG